MRILLIRGENLASLYGRFELPLDRGPIADTGLFSISGPTGAGKSTLVDALCLALFGRTPRLGDRGRSVMVGRPEDEPGLRVDANDERSILSRGAGEGHAQVEFEGTDGVRYRATWRVRRARGRTEGKLQAPRMELEDLDAGQPISDSLSGVPAEVARRIGYSFDEFKRAVVLPQFEFTAFLKAKPDERAAILERVTGTDVYSRLSVAAFRRASEEAEALRRLDDRLAQVTLLTEEERRALEARAAELTVGREAARAAAAAAAEAVRWHALARTLESERAGAERALADATAHRDAAGAARAELGAVEAAEPLRAIHQEAARTVAERTAAAERHRAAVETLAAADAALAEATSECDRAERAAADAAGIAERARPALAEARRLDAAVAEAARRSAAARDARARAAQEEAAATGEAASAAREVARRESERDAAAAWIRAREPERALASEWPRWRAVLQAHAGHVRDLAAREAALATARRRREETEARRETLAREASAREAEFARVEARAREAAATAAADDLAALKRSAETLGDRRERLTALRALAEDARKARALRERASAEAAAAGATLAQSAEEQRRLETALVAARASADAERAALERIVAALGLEEHRAALVEGEPCPLCGSEDHPYAAGAPGQPLRRQQIVAVEAAEGRVEALRRTAAQVGRENARAEEQARRARETVSEGEAALAAASARYAALRAQDDSSGAPDRAEDAGERLDALLAAAEGALAAGRAAQEAALRRGEAAAAARKALDAARGTLEREREALRLAERARDAAAAEVEKQAESAAALRALRDGLEADLEPVLAFREGWRAAARRDGGAFARACEALTAEHAGHERARDGATEALAALRAGVEGARARVEERRRAVAEATRALDAETAALEAARAERAAVLEGRAADDVERSLTLAARGAADASERARAARARADRCQAEASQAVRGAADAAEAARAAAERAEAALTAALAAGGLERARLGALLARGADWIAGTRATLAGLDRAVHEAETTLAERARRVEQHGAAARPALREDEAAQRLADAEGAERDAAEALSQVQLRLREDAQHRSRHEALAGERTRQAAASERWQRLARVIGSSDGKVFRMYAQGLALDALLHHANHHLRRLAPRYGLMRVPGTNLDLQVVDHDLGDEVRTVNGLSGGETFLVSLALALGLASLSTRATHARTLFIDEGFGTLDRDTLENAMVALDGLRATGRTVGVISHVPELHERIGVRVTVERVSAGRSRVVLPEGSAGAAPPARRRTRAAS